MEVYCLDAFVAEIKLNISEGKSLTDEQSTEIVDKKFLQNFI